MSLCLGKRKAICRPLVLTVRAHSSNAMTGTPDHEQTRSCRRSESDPFTFLRTSCPADHFESFLSMRSRSTYLCTGQKAVLVRIPFFRRAIRFETNSRAIRIYACRVKSGFTWISASSYFAHFWPSVHFIYRSVNYAVYLYAVQVCVYRCRLRSIEKKQVRRKNAKRMINRWR